MANTSMNRGLPPRPPWPDADQGFCTMKPSDYFHMDKNEGDSHTDKKNMEKKDRQVCQSNAGQGFCTMKPSNHPHENKNVGDLRSNKKDMVKEDRQNCQHVKKKRKRGRSLKIPLMIYRRWITKSLKSLTTKLKI